MYFIRIEAQQEAPESMGARKVPGSSGSFKSSRQAGWRLSNAARILLAMVLGCLLAWRPCLGQLETNAYISNRDSSNVSVIDTATNTVIGSPIVGPGPIGVALTPDGRFGYIANNFTNTISVIDVATNTVVGSPITVGNAPFGVAATPDAKFAYITNFGSNTVSVIDTSTNTVIVPSIAVGIEPVGVCVTPSGAFAYVTNVANNTVSVISTATNTVVGSSNSSGKPA